MFLGAWASLPGPQLLPVLDQPGRVLGGAMRPWAQRFDLRGAESAAFHYGPVRSLIKNPRRRSMAPVQRRLKLALPI